MKKSLTDKSLKDMIKNQLYRTYKLCIMDIFSFIDNPFLYNKKNSILSLIFHKYFKHSDIPVSIPIFAFFVCISSILTRKGCRFSVPEASINGNTLDLWILLLADSGCSKTYASNKIIQLFPEGTLSPQIQNIVSEKALCLEMKRISSGLWVQDEGLKFLLSIENKNSPLQAVKPLLLELKTSGKYTRIHSKAEESIVLIDNAYSLLFLGTCREFDLNKKMLKSTYDGLFRRFQFVDGSDKLGRKMEDYPLYRFPIEQTKHLEQRIKAVLDQEFFPNYEFKKEAIDLYETTFKALFQREEKIYVKYGVDEGIYRTYMMEAFKFAVIDHITNLKPGHIVDEHSLQTGLQIVVYLLNCYIHLLNERKTNIFNIPNSETTNSTQLQVNIKEKKLNRIIDYLQQNPTEKSRTICRLYGIKKEDLLKIKQHVFK
jgi:hypothetical protein